MCREFPVSLRYSLMRNLQDRPSNRPSCNDTEYPKPMTAKQLKQFSDRVPNLMRIPSLATTHTSLSLSHFPFWQNRIFHNLEVARSQLHFHDICLHSCWKCALTCSKLAAFVFLSLQQKVHDIQPCVIITVETGPAKGNTHCSELSSWKQGSPQARSVYLWSRISQLLRRCTLALST